MFREEKNDNANREITQEQREWAWEEATLIPLSVPHCPYPKRNSIYTITLGIFPFPNTHQLPLRITGLIRDVKIGLETRVPYFLLLLEPENKPLSLAPVSGVLAFKVAGSQPVFSYNNFLKSELHLPTFWNLASWLVNPSISPKVFIYYKSKSIRHCNDYFSIYKKQLCYFRFTHTPSRI